jgi:uncharacterized protein (DUF3820 family)
MKPALTDLDRMTFCKFKGELMQDVPASYFHYLWANGLKSEVLTNPVAGYIYANIDALKKEYPDGIWT